MFEMPYWILDEDNKPVLADLKTYREYRKNSFRIKEQRVIYGVVVEISTVVLPSDINLMSIEQSRSPGYKPLIFETMVFGGQHGGFCRNYYDYNEAIKGHAKAVKLVTETVVLSNDVIVCLDPARVPSFSEKKKRLIDM